LQENMTGFYKNFIHTTNKDNLVHVINSKLYKIRGKFSFIKLATAPNLEFLHSFLR
jgi:hypothetical protein